MFEAFQCSQTLQSYNSFSVGSVGQALLQERHAYVHVYRNSLLLRLFMKMG